MSRYRDELTASEIRLLEHEMEHESEKKAGFWQQSKFFRATIITASLGGMIQGWTQSVNNGTINGMPQDLGLCITRDNCDGNTADLWTFGMLNAIPLLSAAIFGTTVADPLQENYLGRRGSIMLSCCITVASTIGASATHSVAQLAICRAINGIALGAKASIVPIYAAETSPEHIRGAILANWQLADAAGIFLAFVVNLAIVSYVSNASVSWRILTNTALIPTIPLLLLIYLMPESPRYLMKHGRYQKALQAFEFLQTTRLLASRDFMYAHAQLDFESRLLHGGANQRENLAERIAGSSSRVLQVVDSEPGSIRLVERDASQTLISPADQVLRITERSACETSAPRDSHQASRDETQAKTIVSKEVQGIVSTDPDMQVRTEKDNPYLYIIGVTGYFKRLRELWINRRCRRALLSAGVAMISQQMTGVNTIAFLGTAVWQNSLGPESPAKVSAIIGLIWGAANYFGGLPAYWLSDRIGRSILLAIGLPNMAWSMLVFAMLFQMPEGSSARVPLVSVFAVIFTLFYAPTAGTSPFSISAEVFPLVSREVGMAVSVAINLFGAGILVLVFPMLMHQIGTTGSLAIFAGLNLVAFVLVYLFVPETRRRTLEELQFTFDLRTRWHVEYRVTYIRHHFTKYWWQYLTRKDVPPPLPFYRWARETHRDEVDLT
ncbi:MFS general substrate transporter [Bimuria novae-zelandiae CBS 107.79]|uniref:MFS general substrate transporter n=1 Tax=Bimuria novae-zelandiae CBS 107.79 TaxID=1447943 RepID=A0A6A5VV85_9PLEO|nr:MFS general substrate transporter [Bimuria novae-zelandiae CBS 107.79]